MFNSDIAARGELHDPPLRRLLRVSRTHRLHPGLVLVGVLRLDPQFVLDLRWPAVDTSAGWIQQGEELVSLPSAVSQLLEWHAARQRLDRTRSLIWSGTDHVLVDQGGWQYDLESADAAMGLFCAQIGLPAIPFATLRHPCLG